jgi:outer membrane protein OmpA-like peptidoglycan-associated protein
MKHISFALALLAATSAFAADLSGASDPAFMQRFKGSEIVDAVHAPYVQYKFGVDPYWDKPTQTVEGSLSRTVYRLTGGHTGIEVIRNYEQSLAAKGFKVIYEAPFGAGMASNNYVQGVYYQNFQKLPPWSGGMFSYSAMQEADGVVEQGVVDGKSTTVVVAVATFGQPHETTFFGRDSKLQLASGDLGIIVDVVTSAAIQNQMVTVKAADMADALATKGSIDLYGIYFDTDKALVKPDSKPTLDEIASLLKIDRSLKLEVSGHTDNTGTAAHNLVLSQQRAAAVVAALVADGIDPTRLVPKGYGDTKPVAPNTTDEGKAKNRRVELRKL